MTYIGIRQRESRPQEPKGSRSQKKRRLEEKERSVDWKLIVEISLLLSFFFFFLSFGQKRQRREGGRGGGGGGGGGRAKTQMSESPRGLLCVHTKTKWQR